MRMTSADNPIFDMIDDKNRIGRRTKLTATTKSELILKLKAMDKLDAACNVVEDTLLAVSTHDGRARNFFLRRLQWRARPATSDP